MSAKIETLSISVEMQKSNMAAKNNILDMYVCSVHDPCSKY